MPSALRVCPKCHTEYQPPSMTCPVDGESLLDLGDELERSGDTPALVPIARRYGDLGPYHLLRPLGEGAMAVVYVAEHVKLARRCAIKRLRAEHLVNGEMVHRFLVEARTLAAITHPNLVTIYDVVEDGGEAYLAMELLDGRDLQTALQTGPFTVERALRVGVEICDALAAVHSRGIIHRDVKPANVFLCIVSGREQVKLLDFGAACLHKADAAYEARLEVEGRTLGSPLYMSPEQVAGEPVDARSDVYSVGVVLYEMLTGQPPFEGVTYSDVMLQHMHGEPKPLPNVPAELAELVLRCLAKSPAERPRSAAELAAELRRVGGPLGLEQTLPTGWGAIANASAPAAAGEAGQPRREKRLRRRLIAGGTLLVVASVGTGLSLRARPRAPAESVPGHPSGPVGPEAAPAVASTERLVEFSSKPAGVAVGPVDSATGCFTPCRLRLPLSPVAITFRKPGFTAVTQVLAAGEQRAYAELHALPVSPPSLGGPLPTASAKPSPLRPAAPSETMGAGTTQTLNPFESSR